MSDEEIFDEPEDPGPRRGFGPVFTASYMTDCESCEEPIMAGEDCRADGYGGWIHADDMCERVARRNV